MLTKFLSGLIGLILFFELNRPLAICQSQTNPALAQADKQQTSGKRVYVRRELKPNRVSGLAPVNYFGSGFGLGYDRLIANDFHLGFSAIFSKARLEGDTAFQVKEFLNGDMLRLSITPRYFFWRSFFVGAGFHASSIEGQFGFYGEDIVDSRSERDFKAVHLSGDIIVGDEWRLDSFFIALDWLGLSYAQSTSIKSEENSVLEQQSLFITGDPSDTRIKQEIVAQFRLTYLTFRFGYTF
ncbi:MAG: hypothetical protein ACOH5I_11160 [Oligoflexus sp.]